MNKNFLVGAISMALLTFVAVPFLASAHEHDMFTVNGKTYQFVVGSLNEPVAVDDKTGIDFRLAEVGSVPSSKTNVPNDGDGDSAAGSPVIGVEQTLKVELIAGDQKKVLNLVPSYGQPGSYTASFYPTVQTTYTYRFFGTLNNTPIDLSFTCNPAGNPQAREDKTLLKVSDIVTRTDKAGAFGCPTSKGELGFPEQVHPMSELKQGTDQAVADSTRAARRASDLNALAITALALSVVGIVIGVTRRHK